MEKAKYDIVFDSSEKWKELILDRELCIIINLMIRNWDN